MPDSIALIVDDEQDIRNLLSMALTRIGLQVKTANSLQEAKAILANEHFDLCLTDMRLPDGSGIALIEHVAAHYGAMPIAMITAYGDVQSAVSALKAGAYDFVSKPIDLGTLRALVNEALELRGQNNGPAGNLVGDSNGVQTLREKIERLSRSLAPILITGEAGTGKQLVAKQIHKHSPRSKSPFYELQCDAYTPTQLEEAIFGKAGAFIRAQNGTLFMDHIECLPLPVQNKLHKAIQDRSIRTMGAFADTAIDVRLITASRLDLSKEVAARRFEQDLLYRINVIELPVPPLRERKDDILPLANAFLEELSEHGSGTLLTLTPEAEQRLLAHDFPGNVRELENILERAVALAEGNFIEAGDLQFMKESPASGSPAKALPEALQQLERSQIESALENCRFNKTKAAAQLGITFRALRYKMEKLGME